MRGGRVPPVVRAVPPSASMRRLAGVRRCTSPGAQWTAEGTEGAAIAVALPAASMPKTATPPAVQPYPSWTRRTSISPWPDRGIAVGRVAIGPADREPIWAVAVTTCTREKTTLTGMDAVTPVQDRPVHRSATPKALAARLADAQDSVLVVPRATTRAATRAVTSPTRPGTRPRSGGADARLRGLLGGRRSQPPSTPC
ncbi:MAG: hypothetical protein V7633_1494 [Pseudonocardia sp.]|jgi:hypothetical protein